MRLKRVELENFRLHSHSVLEIGDASFIVIRGLNMAGKSSIPQAISMVLTPSTDGLDPKGTGYADKIKIGASKAVISADVQGKNHAVRRTVTLNTNTTGRTSKSECLDDPEWNAYPFDTQLEKNRAALLVAINTDMFIHMEEKEQKKLLAQLVLPSHYEFPQETISAVNKALGEGVIKFSGEPFEIIETAYKKLFQERQVCNRQVKEFVIPDPLPIPNGIDLPALEARLKEAKDEKRKLEERRSAAVAGAKQLSASKASLEQRIRNHQEKVDYETGEYRTVEHDILSEARLKAAQELAKMKPTLDKLTQESSILAERLKQQKAASEKFEAIPDVGSKCPTCEQIISEERMKAIADAMNIERLATQKQYDATMQQIKALGDIEGAISSIAKHNKAVEEKKRIEGILAEKTNLLKTDTEMLVKLNQTEDTSSSFDEAIRKLEEQIDVLLQQIRPVIAAEERRKEIELRKEQLAQLQAKAKNLNDLVVYFDKDGIKKTLIKEYIGGFESKINETMKAWKYTCALSLEPYAFNVTVARGETLPVKELCGAEKVMFSAALQCAVARTANIGFAVVDEVAMFHPEIRPILNQKLYEMVDQKLLEQMIMIVADTSESGPPAHIKNAAFYMVQDGATRLLGRTT